jgi:electron transfer flavoprotein beta subunit
MLNIIVTMKVIVDPEMPFSIFKVDRENKKPLPAAGSPPVFSPFDENALEAALKIKDRQPSHITVLCLGKTIPKSLAQKAMAAGADDVIAIEGPELDTPDYFTTAHYLAAAIEQIGQFDLIFTGRQGADWDAGMVWAGITELLDIPCITLARKASISGQVIIVERCLQDGIETLEASMPVLVTFSNEGGDLRNISLAALMKVKKKQVTKLSVADFDFEKKPQVELRDLYLPDIGGTDCDMISGSSPEEKGRNLAKQLFS